MKEEEEHKNNELNMIQTET